MRYCSSSLFSSSVDQIKGSGCISCSWACYWCIKHGLLLSILSSSSFISSFVVSIAHLEWKIFFPLRFSPVDITYGCFGHHIWTPPKSALSPLFFFYLGAFVHKVEGRAFLKCILDMDGTCNKVILSVEIPPVGNTKRSRFPHSLTCYIVPRPDYECGIVEKVKVISFSCIWLHMWLLHEFVVKYLLLLS